MKIELPIFDALGYEWRWDGERVYMVAAEKGLGKQNGYPANTAEAALSILLECGYMEKE